MTSHLNVGMKCIKYMLFVANFMFVMVGVLLISFGSTIKAIYKDFELFMEDHYFSPATLVIAVGIIIMLIAAFGCAAAIKESTCMVNMYAVLLLVTLVLELSASIAAYAMRSNIKLLMKDKMSEVMDDYKTDNESTLAVDFLQQSLLCCGVNHNEEWIIRDIHTTINVNETTSYNYIYPESCCNPRFLPTKCLPFGKGCLDKLTWIISQSTVMLGTGALCIAFVQVLGIGFAIMLAKSIRRLKTQAEALRWQTRQELYLQLARGTDKPNNIPVVYTPEGAQVES